MSNLRVPIPAPPTPAEVIEELNAVARMMRISYAEADGVVRDPEALRTIALLKSAAKIVRSASARAATKAK